MKYRATVKNGELIINNLEMYQKEIQSLEGLDFFIKVEKIKKDRSLSQNAYYFGVVIDILSNETGYTPEEMHRVLKSKFLNYEQLFTFKDINEKIQTQVSTTDLNTVEFEKYLSDIRTWAAQDLNIYIPLPNESEDYINFT